MTPQIQDQLLRIRIDSILNPLADYTSNLNKNKRSFGLLVEDAKTEIFRLVKENETRK